MFSLVVPEVTVRADVITAGVMFDDGTITRTIAASDFDELGQYRLRFIKPDSVPTANCHSLNLFQGTQLIAE